MRRLESRLRKEKIPKENTGKRKLLEDDTEENEDDAEKRNKR